MVAIVAQYLVVSKGRNIKKYIEGTIHIPVCGLMDSRTREFASLVVIDAQYLLVSKGCYIKKYIKGAIQITIIVPAKGPPSSSSSS